MKEVVLSQGKIAIVDDDDYQRVARHKWTFCHGYALRNERIGTNKYKRVYLHRFVLEASGEAPVDHINGNRLDNRKANLRICTQAENSRNRGPSRVAHKTSRFKGVSWKAEDKCWRATIVAGGKAHHLGAFDSEEAAAVAYNMAAKKLHGEFAVLNDVAYTEDVGASRRSPYKTHCPHGHAYDLLNTRWDKNGVKHCRSCERIKGRLKRLRQREEKPARG